MKKKLLAFAICCTSAATLMFGVKAATYKDRYSGIASWSNATGYTAKYYGMAKFNENTHKFDSNAMIKRYSGSAVTITTQGHTDNRSNVVIRGNIAAPNDYTNAISRTVYSTSSTTEP